MSVSFDRKLEALQAFIVSSLPPMQFQDHVSMSARLSHLNFIPAPPEVRVPGPAHGPEAFPHEPEKTVGFNQEFQASGVEQVPSGFRIPFPVVQSECTDRVNMLDSDTGQNPPDAPVDSVPH